MPEFDEDIQDDLDNRRIYALACLAQDLRDTLRHANTRSLLAARKRLSAERDRHDQNHH
jgi:hypothetical protein